jgi:hypothetical protein
MQSAQMTYKINVSKETVEDWINEEATRFLRGAGLIPPGSVINFTFPGEKTLTLPVEFKEIKEERVVLTVL